MRGSYFAATFVFLLNAFCAAAQPQYTLVDLGSLGGDWTIAYGINAAGDVVGVSTTTVVGPQHAFLYHGGQMIDVHPAGVESTAFAINNSGQIVGRYSDYNTYGFIYHDGQVTGMPGSVVGTAVNEAGAVAGTAFMPYQSPMLYVNGSVRDISPYSPAIGLATDVNNLGHAVGYASGLGSGAPNQAFFYNGQTSSLLSLPTAINSVAYSVNDHDAIAGEMTAGVAPVAFYLHDGQLQQIGNLGSNISGARDINNQGQIVGWSYTSASQVHGFLFEDGATFDLNSLLKEPSTFQIQYAYAINDAGEIVGQGEIDGKTHGFLLVPIPEPHTIALALIAALGCLLRHRSIRA